jgi:hypothetical protein
MILTAFIDKLERQLPDSRWRLEVSKSPMVVFAAVSERFGDIEVAEEVEELVIYFGRFTHTHFSYYDDDLGEAERIDLIASNAIACLTDVFADRLEFYGISSGSGGFRQRGSQAPLPSRIADRSTHLWSGQDA